ncbi:glycosyltransferase family 2 protein [Brevibacillus sp. SYSU BS000544]|uniref:glycosyltransferase family 2 protein n=1 Tax=Brevibacillus sp. SYSU BS000544 TaxID=3416443 RepID=UPI003CE48C56
MKKLSVIIPAQNEEGTIQAVIHEAQKLKPYEIIVVINGSTDRTFDLISTLDCKVIQFPEPLGNDVGRAVGAYYSTGDFYLFLDADIVIKGEELMPFVEAMNRGAQVAFNNLDWSGALPIRPHITTVAKVAFNWITRRIQSVNSLLAVPHAISKYAVDSIGFWNLADPIVAQTLLTELQVSMVTPASIDVITRNRLRPIHFTNHVHSPYPITTDRIIGDHLASIHHLIVQKGPRCGFHDGYKNRQLVQNYVPQYNLTKAKRSAVIPVTKEKEGIQAVIQSVQLAGVDEIIVVANGSDSETIEIARTAGAIVITFPTPLGHNVGRAIGAAISTGEVVLFVDGDFAIPPADLVPFIQAIENGVDVALNDLQSLLDKFHPLDIISAVKYFLNLSVKRPDLLNNSMTAVPHAMHRRVIDSIGFDKLMVPPLAQVHALLAGFNVNAVHYVDVIKPNRMRDDHTMNNSYTSAFDRITGDHIEALHYLFQVTNSRGGFSDGERYRSILTTLRGEK